MGRYKVRLEFEFDEADEVYTVNGQGQESAALLEITIRQTVHQLWISKEPANKQTVGGEEVKPAPVKEI